jgi:hypothetical protein
MSISANFPNVKPSLLLDFANAQQLPPSVTFTRATTAAYYNGSTTAKAEQNIFQQSQTFDNAYWLKFQGTITANTTTAPDGTSTADTFAEGSGGVTPSLYVNAGAKQENETFTLSIYAKANGRNYFWLKQRAGTDNYIVGVYDLSAPSVSKTQAGTGDTIISTSITSVGSGWYRLTLTGFTGGTNNSEILFGLSDTGTPAIDVEGNIAAYTGNGTSGAYVWGAQFEARSSATAYTPTTTQPITNYIPVLLTAGGGQPRFDHNPTTSESLGLLIEQQSTNLFTYSSDLSDAAWTKTNATVTSNTIVAPDGTLTGDKIIADSTSAVHFVYQAATSAGSRAFSCYLKKGEYSFVALTLYTFDDTAKFNLDTGVVVSVSGNMTSATIQSVGNGWYRCTCISSNTPVSYQWIISPLPDSTNFGYIGNSFNGIYAWGAQVEAGSLSTSYIPTTTAAATRAADAASMTGTNFSSWYNSAQGTLYGEAIETVLGGSRNVAQLYSSTGPNQTRLYFGNNVAGSGTSYAQMYLQYNSVDQAFPGVSGAVVAGTAYRFATALKTDDFAISANGSAVDTDTSGIFGAFNILYIGSTNAGTDFLNGTIKKIAYYPIRVTNAQLQALTT